MIRAVLFDLGNTLVRYYDTHQFPGVLRECLAECSVALAWSADADRDRRLFERELSFNQERSDFAVRPLGERLQAIFGAHVAIDDDAFAH